jgi:hypothetical protein
MRLEHRLVPHVANLAVPVPFVVAKGRSGGGDREQQQRDAGTEPNPIPAPHALDTRPAAAFGQGAHARSRTVKQVAFRFRMG